MAVALDIKHGAHHDINSDVGFCHSMMCALRTTKPCQIDVGPSLLDMGLAESWDLTTISFAAARE